MTSCSGGCTEHFDRACPGKMGCIASPWQGHGEQKPAAKHKPWEVRAAGQIKLGALFDQVR